MTTPESVSPAPDTEALRNGQLWSVLDWSLWGNGLGDVLRSEMADVMVAALTPEQREQAEACIRSWHDRRSPSMAVGVGTQLQRERDEARAEVDRLKSYLLGRRNNLAQLLGQPASEEDTGWYGLCAQVQEREAGLRADLDQARAELGDLRHNLALRAFTAPAADDETMLASLDARIADALASPGARTIPDDAAERLRKLAADFRQRAEQSVTDGTSGEPFEDECDSPAECHAAANHFTWKLAALQVEKLASSWATPTTDPAPAAVDGHEDVQGGVQRADGVLDQRDDEDDARDHLTWFDAGTAEVVKRDVVYGSWTSEPATPQAPAQPTDLPGSLLSATLIGLGITQAELARRTGLSTKHINRVIQGKAGLGVDLANALAEVTGVPAARWLHAEANRLSGPAAREDTAPPDEPMPADEKPKLAHTTGWRGAVERAALRCADVDRRNWNLISETDREHYRQYGMAMHQTLPPHIAGELSHYLTEQAERDDAAPWVGHEVTVSEDVDCWQAHCRDCGVTELGTETAVKDWADAHRADNLIPVRTEEA